MRIAIMGVGAVGGLYGHWLVKAGHDVVFVARGRTLDRLKSEGLTLVEPDGSRETIPVQAIEAAALAHEAPIDAALLCVKTWQVHEAAEQLRPVMRAADTHDPLAEAEWATGIATMQNGVESPSHVESVLGPGSAIVGTTKVLCELDEPGVVNRVDFTPRVSIGEHDNTRSPRVLALARAMNDAGIETTVPDDIHRALWEKFSFLVAYGGLCAATRFPLGVVRAVPETRALLDAAVCEIQAVGRALGVRMPNDQPEHILDFLDTVPEGTTSSMMRDLLAGRPSELEAQTGAVVRLGRTAGVPTPTHSMLYAVLRPGELVARGERPEARFG